MTVNDKGSMAQAMTARATLRCDNDRVLKLVSPGLLAPGWTAEGTTCGVSRVDSWVQILALSLLHLMLFSSVVTSVVLLSCVKVIWFSSVQFMLCVFM